MLKIKYLISYNISFLLVFLFFLKIFTPSVAAQNEKLSEAILRYANDEDMRHGQLGVCVMDVNTGQVLAGHNATMSLIPASNMKIVTTAAGLKILGADFKFKTELQYDGEIKDSVLQGNLYIKGYGDPTLGSPLMDSIPRMQTVLDSFAFIVSQLGIKKITGKIVGDGTSFEPSTATMTWLWEDLGNYYGAGPSGLNFNENLYELTFNQSTSIDTPPSVVSLVPGIPDFKLYNEVKSVGGGGEDAYIFAAPYGNVGIVRGTISTGSKKIAINGAIPDPPYFAAWHLRRTLIEKNILVEDSATTQLNLMQRELASSAERKTFFRWESPNLRVVTQRANLESVNLYCEAILRAISLQQNGRGSNDKGTEIVKQFWSSKGVDVSGLFMQDGSGLSPRNGLTPYQMTSMLRTIALDSLWFADFRNTLPVAGLSGTMKNMFKKYPSVVGKVWAKSGTITRVRAYSGYAINAEGRLLVFSVIANNFLCSQSEIRKKMEHFIAELVK